MFGARELTAMQPLDFFAIFAELANHGVEMATEIADFIVPFAEAHLDGEVAGLNFFDLLLEFDQRLPQQYA